MYCDAFTNMLEVLLPILLNMSEQPRGKDAPGYWDLIFRTTTNIISHDPIFKALGRGFNKHSCDSLLKILFSVKYV